MHKIYIYQFKLRWGNVIFFFMQNKKNICIWAYSKVKTWGKLIQSKQAARSLELSIPLGTEYKNRGFTWNTPKNAKSTSFKCSFASI